MKNLFIIAVIWMLGACSTDTPNPSSKGNTTNSEWYAEFSIDGNNINLYSNPSTLFAGRPYSPYGFMRAAKSSSSNFQLVINDSLLNPLFQIDLQLKDTITGTYYLDTNEFKKGYGNRFTLSDVTNKWFYDAFGALYQEYGVSSSPLYPSISVNIEKYDGLPVIDANGYYKRIGSVMGTINGTVVKKSGAGFALVPLTGKFKIPIY